MGLARLVCLGLTAVVLGTATPSGAAVLTLAWEDHAVNEDGFAVERTVRGSAAFQLIGLARPNSTEFVDAAVTAGTDYCYRVRSFNSYGVSEPSNVDCGVARQLEAPALFVTVSVDESVMTVTATLVPGRTPVLVDAYIVVRAPDGRLFSIVGPGMVAPGVVPAVRQLIPVPLSGEILRYEFSGREPAGTYRWFAALAHAGTHALVGELMERSLVKLP